MHPAACQGPGMYPALIVHGNSEVGPGGIVRTELASGPMISDAGRSRRRHFGEFGGRSRPGDRLGTRVVTQVPSGGVLEVVR